MEYNTNRSQLQMFEYGRNVQTMAEHLLTIEEPEKRRQQAEIVVEVMAILNPQLKTVEDYKHKLWDHLYQMTDFKLEIPEPPYEAPTREEAFARPEPLHYPQSKMRNRHFGKKFDELLARAVAEQDAERRQAFTQALGYYMKLAYINWHKEQVHDDMIKNELTQLSGGLLQYETGGYRVSFTPQAGGQQSGNRMGAKSGGNRNFRSGNPQGGNRNFNNNNGGQAGGNQQGGNKRKFYKNKNK